MTDKDVIEKIQELFGGRIYYRKPQKVGYKESWQWRLNGHHSKEFVLAIYPFLMERRRVRADQYLLALDNLFGPRGRKTERNEEMVKMALDGMKHKDIADFFGVTRSAVTHIISRSN